MDMQTISVSIGPIKTIKAAKAIAGPLGNPSKMPGKSYGLPALACHIGAILRKLAGSTCSLCYALRGNYMFKNVLACQHRRLASIYHPQWIEAMALMISRQVSRADPYFRWHDSGDLQSLDHLDSICQIARLCPWVKFWLPTREAAMVRRYRRRNRIPRNLRIRASAAMIDGAPPAGFRHTSSVHKRSTPIGHACPAPTQGNSCGDCRLCWSEVRNVSYHAH